MKNITFWHEHLIHKGFVWKTNLFIALSFMYMGLCSAQNTIYVNQNATGNNDGTSWTDAFVLLESALITATQNTNIWIAGGTYKPDFPGGSRFSAFLISQPNIGIYGGFAGNETQLSQRIYGQNETILSGDLNGDDNANIDYFEPTRLDNSYRVLQILSLADGVVLDRLTITGGHSNAANNTDGAGIRVGSTDLTVTDCKIYRNVARNRGAGIYLSLGGGNGTQRTFEVNRCQFIENLTREGAGIHYTHNSSDALNFSVRNSLFIRNETRNIGDPGTSGSSCFFSSIGNYTADWTNNTSAFNTENGTFHNGPQSAINHRTTLTVVSPATNGQTFFVYNSIFYNNTLFNGNPLPGLGFNNSTAFPFFNISHSTDEGGFVNTLTSAGHTWVDVNTTNPQFVNTNNDDFRLSGSSSARDTGNVNAPTGSLDLAQNPRNQGFTIDRGAYEATPIPPGTIVYVDQDATGANNGSSWTDAYTDLHTALSNVAFQGQIWIAGGTYKPSPTGFRTESFTINTAEIEIYGGFAGTETQLSERIYGTNTTYIDGDNFGDDNGSTLDYFSSVRTNDNAFNVIKINANGSGVLFDSIFIAGGHANSGTASQSGGAILVDDSVTELTLNKVIVADNISRNTGGAISWSPNNSAQLNIYGCRFARNYSRNGGALFFSITNSGNYNIEIINSIFELNLAADIGNVQGRAGSSLYAAVNNSSATLNTLLVNNTFAANTDGGTILAQSQRTTVAIGQISGSASTNVYNSIFWENLNSSTSSTSLANAVGSLNFSSGSWDVRYCLDAFFFSNIIGNSNTTVNNIITQDPLFALTANSNHQYSIINGSPAIDAGNNSLVPANSITDFLNNQRIFSTTVDMGAYEFNSIPLSSNGLDNTSDTDIKIYPNPTTDFLNIATNNEVLKLRIFDINGKEFLNQEYSTTIDIRHLNSGIYFIQLFINNSSVITKKIVKL